MNLNIRIEKVPLKIPKLVNIETHKKQKFSKEALMIINEFRHLIILGRNDKEDDRGYKARCFTTMEPHEVLWSIEQLKKSIL